MLVDNSQALPNLNPIQETTGGGIFLDDRHKAGLRTEVTTKEQRSDKPYCPLPELCSGAPGIATNGAFLLRTMFATRWRPSLLVTRMLLVASQVIHNNRHVMTLL